MRYDEIQFTITNAHFACCHDEACLPAQQRLLLLLAEVKGTKSLRLISGFAEHRFSMGSTFSQSHGKGTKSFETSLVVGGIVCSAVASAALTAAYLRFAGAPSFPQPPCAKRIIICRHGESEGNVDTNVYQTTPDWQVGLTAKGKAQATNLGKKLRRIIQDDPVICFVSPYRRTRQTLKYLLQGMAVEATASSSAEMRAPPCSVCSRPVCNCAAATPRAYVRYTGMTDRPGVEGPGAAPWPAGEADACEASGCNMVMVREEPRIREQDFGNFQRTRRHSVYWKERREYGKFFFRIPEGESGADVYDRVSSFFDTLHRVFRYEKFDSNTCILIVTHGVTLRSFLMRWFRWGVDTFERSQNPANAAFVQMVRVGSNYRLTHSSAEIIGLSEDETVRARMLHSEEGQPPQPPPAPAGGRHPSPPPPAAGGASVLATVAPAP